MGALLNVRYFENYVLNLVKDSASSSSSSPGSMSDPASSKMICV